MSESEQVVSGETRDSQAWSPDERLCFERGMDQWQKSLARPDMSERDRVAGALDAYMRQAFALAILASHTTEGRAALLERLNYKRGYIEGVRAADAALNPQTPA
jgi:hypothetical protein